MTAKPEKIQFATAYGHKHKQKKVTYPPTMTKQSMRDECDINLIVKNYSQIGVLEHVNNNQQFFGNVSDTDFRASLDLVLDAQKTFDELPAKIRRRFDNDPELLLSFIDDPNNKEEAIELGLIPKPHEYDQPDVGEGEEPTDKSADEPATDKDKA